MRNYDITIFSKSYGADDDRDAFYLSVVATSVDKCLAQLKKFGVDIEDSELVVTVYHKLDNEIVKSASLRNCDGKFIWDIHHNGEVCGDSYWTEDYDPEHPDPFAVRK